MILRHTTKYTSNTKQVKQYSCVKKNGLYNNISSEIIIILRNITKAIFSVTENQEFNINQCRTEQLQLLLVRTMTANQECWYIFSKLYLKLLHALMQWINPLRLKQLIEFLKRKVRMITIQKKVKKT